MRQKHRRKLLIMAVAYLFLGSSVLTPNLYSAASGHYTDLLPNPTSAPNIVQGTLIYNGYDWSVATLAPSQTYGDTLSRAPMTVFQSTASATINATTTVSTFSALSQGSVGSTTFPASWVATGRSMRISVRGTYSIPNAGSTWTWAIKLGTTTVLTTGATTSVSNQTDMPFAATALLTIAATGNTGTVFGAYDIFVCSGTTPRSVLSISTQTISGAVTVDLTSQLTVNPTFTWGTANSSVTVRNVVVEFLN